MCIGLQAAQCLHLHPRPTAEHSERPVENDVGIQEQDHGDSLPVQRGRGGILLPFLALKR